MKLYELKAIATRLNNYTFIKSIYRVDDTIVEITFEKDKKYYFDMTKGNSYIFKQPSYKKIKDYNAPFDITMTKKFAKSQIKEIKTDGENRVLLVVVASKSSYKEEITTLHLEFTGRNTNAIITDSNTKVLEALRHIDSSVSFREIKPNKPLLPIPPKEIKETPQDIEDIDIYLENIAKISEEKKLNGLKKQGHTKVDSKLKKLQKNLSALENEDDLLVESEKFTQKANAVLANLNSINLYEKSMKLSDYEDNEIKVEILPQAKTASHLSNLLFDKSKKLKQKVKNLHIQRENLTQKIEFFDRLKSMISNSTTIDECKLYLISKKHTQKKSQKNELYESFFYQGFKIMVGRTESENIHLLKSASKDDYWFHLKDRASSHVIVNTNKKNLPSEVLEFCAKLCVDFSINQLGDYLVDYTKRANVKVQSGANVLYVNYKTITVRKDRL
jgi:predicted ribosome quality control (RQC) complex YloA/Tae2 family protein